MTENLIFVAALVLVNACTITAELLFEPASLPLVVLVADQSETLQHEVLIRNSGTEGVDVHVAAQCDNDLSPHQPLWALSSIQNFTLGPSAVRKFNVTFTAGSLTQGVHSSRICAFNQTEADTRSGLSPTPLAQIPVQAKVLCSQRGNSSSDQPSCSIKNNQLAVLKPRDTLNLSLSLRTVYFETLVTFNHYPWPEWGSVLDAFQDVTINNGLGSVYNVTTWPAGNSCGTYLLRGTAAMAPPPSKEGAGDMQALHITINSHPANGTNTTGNLIVASIQAPADALPCSLQQEVDMSSLKEIDAVPFLPSPKGAWSPVVKPFSLVPAYLVAGSANNTARAVLSLENTQGIDHSVQVVTNCYNESSAGWDVPWLSISSQDMVVPFNSSQTIDLTYRGEGLAAGTYRAQLCLFADYSYGAVSSVVQVQLLVLCSRYQGYESSPAGCTIKFTEKPSPSYAETSHAFVALPSGFRADLAFNRPVVGAQSKNSLYGMLAANGVPGGEFKKLEEDNGQGLNCGMYHLIGSVTTDGIHTPNVTVQVAGLYDITHVLNACSAQSDE